MNLFYSILFFLLVFFLLIEYALLIQTLKKIPVKILVNGTRGKSTAVSVLYHTLRENGKAVCAKTTGDVPKLYFPDGSQKIVKRLAPAGIFENIRHLRTMARYRPDAIVLECNALQAEMQYILAHYIFKPNHILVTNILTDHQEVMGVEINQHVCVIAECFYPPATIITTQKVADLLKNAEINPENMRIAHLRKFNTQIENVPDSVVSEQWSFVKSTSDELRLDLNITQNVFERLWMEASRHVCIALQNHNLTVWNLFSANDIESTELFIRHAITSVQFEKCDILFVLNSRDDRPLRTRAFVTFLKMNYSNKKIWLTGSGRQLAKQIFLKDDFRNSNLHVLKEDQILEKILAGFTQPTLLFCIGNHKGMENFLTTLLRLREGR